MRTAQRDQDRAALTLTSTLVDGTQPSGVTMLSPGGLAVPWTRTATGDYTFNLPTSIVPLSARASSAGGWLAIAALSTGSLRAILVNQSGVQANATFWLHISGLDKR